MAAMLAGKAVAAPLPSALPPYSAAYEPRTVDERGLWMQVDEAEKQLRASNLLIADPTLGAHVRRVLCRTVGEDRCGSVRLYLLELPGFNAAMMPNGAMLVHSGLLLRTRSEAELGAVLGHEFAHFELRHSLAGFARARSATDAIAWISVLGAASGANVGASVQLLAGAFFTFSRALEKQADLLGLQYLRASPYPAGAASEVWAHLLQEQAATALERKYKPNRGRAAGFFDSHPAPADRADYLRAAAGDDPGDAAVAGHRDGMAMVRLPLLMAQVKTGDFGGTAYLIDALAAQSGWTAELLFARAELYRQRGNPRDLATAAQLYADAIRAGPAPPEAHRGLGLALLRSGDAAGGRVALAEYLRLKPDAGDARLIASLVPEDKP